jgi:hypothetical protein
MGYTSPNFTRKRNKTMTNIATHGSAKAGKREQAVSTFETRSKVAAKVCSKHLKAYKQAA